MTLHDYWTITRRSWLLIVSTTLLGAAAAFGVSQLITPTYVAEAQLFVSVRASDTDATFSGGSYVQQRMKSYVEVVDAPNVLDPVIRQLGLDEAPAVSAENPANTVLINVNATDTDPDRAAAVANATAASMASEIVRLETTPAGVKPVNAELIRPAEIPDTPSAPRTALNVALGALLGLMIGLGIAVLRATLDTSIRSVEDLVAATQATVLGTVAYDSGASKHPLATLQGSPRSEAYRALRTNLKYVDVDHRPRSVVVTSSHPLEGKSTTAVNLAIALAQSDVKVLLIEADLRRPRAADYLGVDGSIGLTDLLIGQAKIDEAIIPWQRGLMDFLPAGRIPPNPSELLSSRQLAELLLILNSRYDVLVLDAPPLLSVTDAAVLSTVADGAILVVRHGKTRREQVEEATDALTQVNGRLFGTVLNFVPQKKRGYGYGYGYLNSEGGQRSRKAEVNSNVLPPDPGSWPRPWPLRRKAHARR